MACTSLNSFVLDNVERFIELVEARPPLYMRDLKEYSDTALKKTLWQEICAELFPNWNDLNDNMRFHRIQRKWLNLRTCFGRELKLQKAAKAGLVSSKRRTYMYFQKLLFLLPTIKNIEIENNGRSEDSESEVDPESDSAETDGTFLKATSLRKVAATEPVEKKPVIGKENLISFPGVFEDHTLPVSRPHLDEDTYFLLSLVPQLQSLTEDEKFGAKIDMLNLFRELKRKRGYNFPTVNIKEEDLTE